MYSKAFILSLALAANAAPAVEQDSSIKVQFQPRRLPLTTADGKFDHINFLHSFNRTLAKYHASHMLPSIDQSKLNRRQSSEPLTDQYEQGTDIEYYGPLQVNTQTGFTADFDTGSADLFVPGPQCGQQQGCHGTQYNQKGTDRHTTTTVTYGSGQIMGEDYFDSVTVAGLTAANTNVISLTSAQGFSTSASNSLLGMGFSTIANSKQPTYFENLISQGKVKTQEFSFFLGRGASGTQGQSELTLGGRNTNKYTGAVTSIPVTKKGYWQVAIDGGSVGKGANTAIAGTSGQAAIDTGTTIILAPSAAAAALYAQIPGAAPIPLSGGGETLYSYPCKSNPVVNLVFGGKSYVINAKDFNLGQAQAGLGSIFGDNPFTDFLDSIFGLGQSCVGAVAGADLFPGQSFWIVGDSFLKNWYSIYNYNGPSVSFAAAKGNQ